MMIAEKTGWSKKSILNDFSFSELIVMYADLPKMIKKKDTTKTEFSDDDEIADWFGAEEI